MSSRFMSKPILVIVTLALVFVALFPILWMVSSSLKGAEELLSSTPSLIPKEPTIRGYEMLLNPPPNHPLAAGGGSMLFLRMILNTLLYAVSTTLLAVPMAILAAYVLAREHLRFKVLLIAFLLFTYLLPPIAIVVPLFQMVADIGLYDSYLGLVLAYQLLVLPLCTWMLAGHFKNIPRELEEAAMIDGCSRMRAIAQVFLPVSAPGIAAVATFSLIVIWQEFVFALVFIKTEALRNVQVGIQYFFQPSFPVDWGTVMAASTIVAIPTALLFAYVQQFLVGGLLKGAVKG